MYVVVRCRLCFLVLLRVLRASMSSEARVTLATFVCLCELNTYFKCDLFVFTVYVLCCVRVLRMLCTDFSW